MATGVSSSRKLSLFTHLVKHVYTGEIQLPRKTVNILHDFDINDGKYQCRMVDKDKMVQNKVKEFMLDNFYSMAPVPVVLKLFMECKMTSYLEDELDLWCQTGVSYGIFQGDRIVGASFNLFVEKTSERLDYVSAREWLNQAAEVATSQTQHNPVHVWRNTQFLHLQHFNQQIISSQGAKFGLHLACGAVEEVYRRKTNIFIPIIRTICNKIWEQGGVVTMVTNVPWQLEHMNEHFPGKVELVDSVRYNDLELTINEKRVFKPLDELDSIKYIYLIP